MKDTIWSSHELLHEIPGLIAEFLLLYPQAFDGLPPICKGDVYVPVIIDSHTWIRQLSVQFLLTVIGHAVPITFNYLVLPHHTP